MIALTMLASVAFVPTGPGPVQHLDITLLRRVPGSARQLDGLVVDGGGIVGVHAGDLIAEIGLAIEMGCEAGDIGHTIHPHPTLSESVGMAAEVFEGSITDLYIPKKK